VWGFTDFEVVNYLIFREKVPEFSPDYSNGWHFLISKKPKDIAGGGRQRAGGRRKILARTEF
jgi:hypothetical protein